ncbi:MAG: hypothetical protein WAW61_22245 [Methylococcaceae bacterium]
MNKNWLGVGSAFFFFVALKLKPEWTAEIVLFMIIPYPILVWYAVKPLSQNDPDDAA